MPSKKVPAGKGDRSGQTGDSAVNPACLTSCLSRCVNCRRELELSMSRLAGRKLRQTRLLDECSVERCVSFLQSIKEEAMRLHLASMAWWRFSADNAAGAEPLLDMIKASKAEVPDSGPAYMHRAIRALSPLSPTQLAIWFGCGNLYQLVDVFTGDRPQKVGRHCTKCGLYKQGCTTYNTLGADDCPFWRDAFVQKLASVLAKAGKWHNPCRGIDMVRREAK